MVPLQYNAEVLIIGKAILIAILGILVAFLVKIILRAGLDKFILRKIFKDKHTYSTLSTMNKVFTEVIQWIIIIWAINTSLIMLEFNFLSKALEFVIANIPQIAGFILIIVVGIIIARLVTARIKEQDIENANEIITLVDLIIIAAFFLTALEFVGVKATALVELYKVILYIIGVIIVLLIINPSFLEKHKKTKKTKGSTTKLLFF